MNEPHDPVRQQGEVYGLDNIELEVPYAGAGSRVMAGVIDYGIFYALTFALAMALIGVLAFLGAGGLEELGGWVLALALLLFFLFESFYFAVQEIVLGGQTLGKRALGLRAVARGGHPASRVSLLLRNLVRSIDLLLGGWFLVFDRRSRRLGDRLGATIVIHEQTDVESGSLERVPRGWGSEQVRVVEELLDRLFVLDNNTARNLSAEVLDAVEREDPDFLRGIPADLAPTVRLGAAFGRRAPEST